MNRLTPLILSVLALLACAGSARGQKTALGVNASDNGYFRTEGKWNDVAKQFTAWDHFATPGNYWKQDPSIKFDAAGYPTTAGAAYTKMLGYPGGTYTLTYEGSGSVIVELGGFRDATSLKKSGNTTSVNVKVSQNNGDMALIATAPVTNVHLWCPGADTSKVLNGRTRDRLSKFRCVRWLDGIGTNVASDSAWSQRPQLGRWCSLNKSRVPYEDIIAACNESGCDVWITLPVNASDDYATKLADLLRDTLAPSLKIHMEYGNEIWHTGFYSGQQVQRLADADTSLTAGGTERRGQKYAERTKHFHDLFAAEFGAQASRVGWVFSGYPRQWEAWGWAFNTAGMAQLGNPAKYLEAYSQAAYVGLWDKDDVAGLTVDGVFKGLNGIYASDTLPSIQKGVAFAKQFGLPYYAYEGGLDVEQRGKNQAVKAQACDVDPRMGPLYTTLYQGFSDTGGSLLCHYAYIDTDSTAYWGLLPDGNKTSAPRWDATMAWVGGGSNMPVVTPPVVAPPPVIPVVVPPVVTPTTQQGGHDVTIDGVRYVPAAN